jgi:hypothetical protein
MKSSRYRNPSGTSSRGTNNESWDATAKSILREPPKNMGVRRTRR